LLRQGSGGAKESRRSRRRKTETGKNYRIRMTRRDVWWHADRVCGITGGHALTGAGALGLAQQYGNRRQRLVSRRLRMKNFLGWLINGTRRLRKKLLIPSNPILPRSPGKRAKLKSRDFSLSAHQKRAGLKRAIADDVAFP